MKYTVLGFWHEDVAYAAGVVEGEPRVLGQAEGLSDESLGFQGPWTQVVEAADPELAESLAIQAMYELEKANRWP